jgi:hypothetical protein
MTSQSAPSSPPIEALNAYDDSSFINEDNSRQEHSGDRTRRPAFPAADDRGFNFHPFEVPRRELLVNDLPQNPLIFFQHFVPVSIVNNWVKYTNDWVNSLPGLPSDQINNQIYQSDQSIQIRYEISSDQSIQTQASVHLIYLNGELP